MPRQTHNHAVWPTPVPAVTTGQWGTQEWTKFEDLNRPSWYHGHRHDQALWDRFMRTREMLQVHYFYWHKFGLVPPDVIWC